MVNSQNRNHDAKRREGKEVEGRKRKEIIIGVLAN